ncbi:MAG: type II toxin-antitoxin system HicA family toxin [Dehalococcoidia bacterium]
MKLPRDLSGQRLATLLRRYEYETVRQTGSHVRLTSRIRSSEHSITIPSHRALSVGTLDGILGEIAQHLEMDKRDLAEELFG